MSAEPILTCTGCGATKPGPDGEITDLAPAVHCEHCPPWTCKKCGETASIEKLCSCWQMVADMTEQEYIETFGGDYDPRHQVISMEWARRQKARRP